MYRNDMHYGFQNILPKNPNNKYLYCDILKFIDIFEVMDDI